MSFTLLDDDDNDTTTKRIETDPNSAGRSGILTATITYNDGSTEDRIFNITITE